MHAGECGGWRPAGVVYLRRVTAEPTLDEVVADCLAVARKAPQQLREICRELAEDDSRRKPGVGKLSAIEHVCHLRDMERDAFGLRLRRLLEEDVPGLERLNMDHYVDEARWRDKTFLQMVEDWEKHRRANIELVEATGPAEWARVGSQPDVGQITFVEVVKQWARHDREHLRQLEIIALNSRERPQA